MGTCYVLFITLCPHGDEAPPLTLGAGRGSYPDREMRHSALTIMLFLFLHQLIPQYMIQYQVDARPGHRQCAIKHRLIGLWRDTGGGKFRLVVGGGQAIDPD